MSIMAVFPLIADHTAIRDSGISMSFTVLTAFLPGKRSQSSPARAEKRKNGRMKSAFTQGTSPAPFPDEEDGADGHLQDVA